MSNPYESILKPMAPLPPKEDKEEKRQTTSATRVKAKAQKKKGYSKPVMRFNVRPRFRFDLPDPPMDPKMLLGRLSTASYARPHISSLEKDFRPSAIPADPMHGLRANLVETSMYAEPAQLSVDDEALLLSVMAGRPGSGVAKNVLDASMGQSQKSVLTTGKPPTNSAPAPWMRRMSYDEYKGGSVNMVRQRLTAKEEAERAAKLAEDRKNDPALVDRRRRALLQSFNFAARNPVHPDKRKTRLTPVHVMPLFPDFNALGDEFTLLEFDQNEKLEHTSQKPEDEEAADESLRTLATLPVDDGWKDSKKDKCIACYAPVKSTLEKRKRLREEDDGPTSSERDKKRIYYAEEEVYVWIGEYSVRESQLGKPHSTGAPVRSCYALSEEASPDEKSKIAFLSRIATSWKLSKRPGTVTQLGEPGLKVLREKDTAGHEQKRKRKISGDKAVKRTKA